MPSRRMTPINPNLAPSLAPNHLPNLHPILSLLSAAQPRVAMRISHQCGFAIVLALLPFALPIAAQEVKGKLLISFASYRERPKYPHIFFYEHDGVASGKITGSVA